MRFRPNTSGDSVSFRSDTFIAKVYGLLAFTLILSFFGSLYGIAHASMISAHSIIMIIGLFTLIFGVGMLSRISTAAGILGVCAFAVFDGVFIGPILSHYLSTPSGSIIVSEAFIGTATIFIVLSTYAVISKKNFSHLYGFLMAGLITAIVFSIVNMLFLHAAVLQMAIAGALILVFSGLILIDTQRVMSGTGSNDVAMIVLSLYLDIINIFLALLEILGMGGRE